MTTAFATSPDSTRIAYDITGQGPALMLLHGAGKTRRDWHKLGYVERLKAHFTVITVDIRGNGESEQRFDFADFAIEKICADVEAVADACDAQQFAIWGYSFGGNIARYLGAWSDRVTAIAMIGVPFGPAVDATFDHYIDQFVKQRTKQARAYIDGTKPRKARLSTVKDHIPTLWVTFQAMRDWPAIEPQAMRCPTLLLTGTKNENTMQWITANRDALDAAEIRIEVVDGLNHNQEFTEIARTYPIVSEFFLSQA